MLIGIELTMDKFGYLDISFILSRSFRYSKLFLVSVDIDKNDINSVKNKAHPVRSILLEGKENNFVSFEFLRNASSQLNKMAVSFQATDLSYYGRVVPVACLQARKPVLSVGRDYRSHWYMVSSNLVYRGDSARTEVRSKQ